MRTTIVPAQITTVEDKIAGNLTLTQIFLLLIPIFIASIVYIVFPPQLHFSLYKILLIITSMILCGLLAIRIKGKVIIHWIVILLRYHSRPRYFVYNKNELYLRDFEEEIASKKTERKKVTIVNSSENSSEQNISIRDIFTLEKYIRDPKANIRFSFSQKGGMYVSVSKVE